MIHLIPLRGCFSHGFKNNKNQGRKQQEAFHNLPQFEKLDAQIPIYTDTKEDNSMAESIQVQIERQSFPEDIPITSDD